MDAISISPVLRVAIRLRMCGCTRHTIRFSPLKRLSVTLRRQVCISRRAPPRSFYYYYCIRPFKCQFSSIIAPIKHHATCNATSLSLSLLRTLICRVHERNDRAVSANEQRREDTFVADHLLMAVTALPARQ